MFLLKHRSTGAFTRDWPLWEVATGVSQSGSVSWYRGCAIDALSEIKVACLLLPWSKWELLGFLHIYIAV